MYETDNMDKFAEFRTHVPVLSHTAYLDTSSTGLVPDFVHDGVARYQEDRYLKGGDSVWRLPGGEETGTIGMMDWAKTQIAQMIGAKKENIVFGNNSSHIYTLFTSGMYFEPGDNVVLVENSWIANRFAWQVRKQDGLEVRYAKAKNGVILPEDLFALCDEKTRAICISLVESFTGFRMDAAAIGAYCREKGIWFAVDGVQALGVMPVDVKAMKIDFLIGNDYKWMMNYCGTGYGYISPALQKSLKQFGAGWMSDDDRFNTGKQVLCLRDDAGRFELGFPTVSGIYGLGLAAEKYLAFSGADISEYVMGLTEYLRERLSETEGVQLTYDFARKNRSGIEVLRLASETGVTNEMLREAGVGAHVSGVDANGFMEIRLAFHYYNNKEDINRLMDVISK
ncbi:aminotransferase class V-fold PLP-dependent enzyme [Ihubacter sp. rT4E-8]|uniref:aminotransferase class V-fold PLP-dependent enzyme n=1 Tax=Ihubacter sp. rT4E-8 TaxID=3242369 RepID=UPI003CE883B2